MTANMDLRFDEEVPCITPEVASMVTNDAMGVPENGSVIISPYSARHALRVFQPLSSQVLCDACPTGRYARSEGSISVLHLR